MFSYETSLTCRLYLAPLWQQFRICGDLSTCQSVNLRACQPVNLSTCQPVNPSTCQPINLSTCQPVNLLIYQTDNLSTCQPVNMTTSQPVNLSTCQPVNQYSWLTGWHVDRSLHILNYCRHYMPFFLAPPEGFDDHWLHVIMMTFSHIGHNLLIHLKS